MVCPRAVCQTPQRMIVTPITNGHYVLLFYAIDLRRRNSRARAIKGLSSSLPIYAFCQSQSSTLPSFPHASTRTPLALCAPVFVFGLSQTTQCLPTLDHLFLRIIPQRTLLSCTRCSTCSHTLSQTLLSAAAPPSVAGSPSLRMREWLVKTYEGSCGSSKMKGAGQYGYMYSLLLTHIFFTRLQIPRPL